MSVFESIEAHYLGLTASEKKVADFFLERKYDIAGQTLSEISEGAQTGEATVVRFCHKMGFESFRDIKLTIDLENAAVNRTVATGYIATIESRVNGSIRKTIEALDLDALDTAVRLIDTADNVAAIGVAFSGLSSEVLAARLIRSGKLCLSVTDPHLQIMYAIWASQKSVLIVFSLSGRTTDILETVKTAKKNGVKIIAVTNFINSPLAKLADVVIQTLSRDGPLSGGNLSSVINQIFVADLLVTGYALLDEEKSIDMRKEVYKSIVRKQMDEL